MHTFVYIDGFNLYHYVNKFSDQNLKWVSLPKLIELFEVKNPKIKFFTSRPEHIKYQGDSKLQRHDNYINLQKALDVEVINGTFKKSNVKCKRCDNHGLLCPKCNTGKMYEHEEKQTDVNLALNIITDCFLYKPNEIIICSSDTDFLPVLKIIKKHSLTKTVKFLIPPNVNKVPQDIRMGLQEFYSLPHYKRQNNHLKITIMNEFHFKKAKLPDEVIIDNKKFINPYL